MLKEVLRELRRLDTVGDTIKVTVNNLNIINSISKKLARIIMTDKYMDGVKDFVQTFNDVTALQNEYWTSVEETFKPKTLLKEIKKQSIQNTVDGLTQAGIGANITAQIKAILKTNITTGGSYASLTDQLREALTDTPKSDGVLTRYAKQITTDAINQYNAQYQHAASAGLGFEWYAYRNSDIITTRPFCDSMTDQPYFHISQVPGMLEARRLDQPMKYVDRKTGKLTTVPIYDKTGLPQGMIDGTNPENFFVYRGGYNCGHQINPVSEIRVPLDIREKVFATPEYKAWKGLD